MGGGCKSSPSLGAATVGSTDFGSATGSSRRDWFDADENNINKKSIDPPNSGGGRGPILVKIPFPQDTSIPFGHFCCQICRSSQMFLLSRHTGGLGVN